MSGHRTACVSNRNEMACGLDPPFAPPNITYDADVECLQ
jgi:hypothetical protein